MFVHFVVGGGNSREGPDTVRLKGIKSCIKGISFKCRRIIFITKLKNYRIIEDPLQQANAIGNGTIWRWSGWFGQSGWSG